MKKSIFIIPQEKMSIICEYDNYTLNEIGKIEIPFNSKTILTENDLFASICFGSKPKSRRLKIFDINGKQLLRKTEYKFESIAVKNNVVYLGGQYKKNESELFSYIDLTDLSFNLTELNLPIKSISGKSIDDILIRNNNLYLIDNIVYPKYIFEYDISIPGEPRHINTKELENNGTYEHIIKGDINNDLMVLFSSTVGMGGAYQHLSIIGKNNITLSYLIENGMFLKEHNKSMEEKKIFDIALLDDYLVILKENEICYMQLNKIISEKNIKNINTNEKKYYKILKLKSNDCIIYNANEYELLKL
jgi:hypothetical protein